MISKYAHSIKNPHIIHFLLKNGRYLCIRSSSITKSKSTRNSEKVTCSNCTRILMKELLRE